VDDSRRTEDAAMRCNRCGEERLVEIVNDARGTQGFCSVCAFSWTIPKN
jgi:formylmethanofuran dehydrogenase subunit E